MVRITSAAPFTVPARPEPEDGEADPEIQHRSKESNGLLDPSAAAGTRVELLVPSALHHTQLQVEQGQQKPPLTYVLQMSRTMRRSSEYWYWSSSWTSCL